MYGKNVMLCKVCNSFYRCVDNTEYCPDCGAPLVETDLESAQFFALPQEERNKVKLEYLQSQGLSYREAASSIYVNPTSNTKWVGFLTFCGILAFIGYLIDGIMKIMMFVTLGDGIKSLVTGLLILAVTGVVKQVVLDIHKIRNDVARHTNR